MKKAFTLIELLVVIAIIAILAAILFPVFAQAKAAAIKTQDLSNYKQIGLANLMYAESADDQFVITNDNNWRPFNFMNHRTSRPSPVLLQPYVKNWELFYAKIDGSNNSASMSRLTPADGPCPAGFEANCRGYRSHFGYNFEFLAPVSNFGGTIGSVPTSIPGTRVSKPSSTIMGVTSAWWRRNGKPEGGGQWVVNPPCEYSATNQVIVPHEGTGWGFIAIGNATTPWDNIAGSPMEFGFIFPFYNNASVMVTFVDGSVKPVPLAQLSKGCNTRTNRLIAGQEENYLWDLD